MQHVYTDEKSVPVNINIPIRQLHLLHKLTERAAKDDWRYEDVNSELEAIIKNVTSSLAWSYEFARERQEQEA